MATASGLLLLMCITISYCLCYVVGNCKRTFSIDKQVQANTCVGKVTSYRCGSLSTAFDRIMQGDCIILTNSTTLDVSITKVKAKDLTISSPVTNTTVFCINQSGLIFSQSKNIVFENITLHGCGTTSAIEWNQQLVNVSSALTFTQCDGVDLRSLHLLSSLGYGLASVDSELSVKESSAIDSQSVKVLQENEQYVVGGGLFVTFQSDDKGSNKRITLESSQFQGTNSNVNSDKAIYDDLPYGRGSGICFSCGPKVNNNIFIANGVTVHGNKANIGAAIYIKFSEDTSNNSFSFVNGKITNNIAQTAGGGVFAITSSENENHIHIKETSISNNTANIGGAITFVWEDTFEDDDQIGLFMLENVTIEANKAQVGGAFHFQNVYVVLKNVNVLNTNVHLGLLGKGSVYALRSQLQFIGEANLIQNNTGSAMVIDNSQMIANGTILFRQNNGDTGGAMAIYEHSRLILTQYSHLLFDSNKAYTEGGAIYAPTAGPPFKPWDTTELNIYECFVKFEKGISYLNFQGNVTFHNNNCTDGDSDDIFVSSLQPCRNTNEKPNHVFSHWPNFHFSSNLSTIATNAISMWSLNSSEWQSYPGNLLKPHVVLQDDRGNNVSESIDVKIYPENKVQVDTNTAFVTSPDDSIKLQLKKNTKHSVAFNITVKTTSNLFLERNLTNMHFEGCPLGYKFDSITGMCECDILNNQKLNIAFCDSEYIYLQKNVWVNPSETNTYTCPNHYCHNDKGRFNHYNKYGQCAQHRQQTSRLCSKCEEGYSAVSGSYECQKCPKNSNGWIGITFILIFSLLVFIILVFMAGLDIMSYNLNICIYSYEVIGLLYTSEQSIDVVLSIVMSIFQVSDRNNIYPTMCLWYGMTGLGKMSMGFIVPTVLLIWMAVLYFICKVKQEIVIRDKTYYLKDRWYKTMSIIIVMCFSDFLRISVQILHYIQIDGKKYVYMYADEEWFGPRHLPHAIVSVIVILILILFSIAQIVLLWKSDVVVFGWLRKFENNVSAYFKMGRNWFWVYYFVCRVFIYCNGILMVNHLKLQKGFMVLICFAICIIFAKLRPYKKALDFVNLIEIIVLSTLAIISILSMGILNIYSTPDQSSLITFVHVLSYIPVLVVPITMFKELYYDRNYNKPDGRKASNPIPVRVTGDYNNVPYQPFTSD